VIITKLQVAPVELDVSSQVEFEPYCLQIQSVSQSVSSWTSSLQPMQ